MKKTILNNKGYMLVEVIIASVMALVVAYFLIDVTIKMVNKNNDYYLKSVLLADKNIITKEIMDDFNDSNIYVTNIEYLDNTDYKKGIKITFSNGDKKELKIESNKIIYGNYIKQFNENITIGDIDITHEQDNETLSIKIPAYSNYSDEDYGIKIAIKYDPTITNIKIPGVVTVTEEYYNQKVKTLKEINFSEVGKYNVTLLAGTYKLEVWGAQGGNGIDSTGAVVSNGGKGGYSYGELTLSNQTSAYVYVGGQGSSSTTEGSFIKGGENGGGAAGYMQGGSGGGASDIRLKEDSLYARVIVAGGGGGGFGYSEDDKAYNGGAGGGTSGTNGTGYSSTFYGKSGKNNGGGTGGGYTTPKGTAGSFGNGGDASTADDTDNLSAGGGGGWYGGGGSGYRDGKTYGGGAGGGSGWVYTSDTYTKKTYTGGEWLLDSSYHLKNTSTNAGTTTFNAPTSDTEETGHSGDGYVRITETSGKLLIIKNEIPYLTGLTDIKIEKGESHDLREGVKLICEINATNCESRSFTINIENTSELPGGKHKIGYIIEDETGNKYKYERQVYVTEIKTTDYLIKIEKSGLRTGIYLEPGRYKLEVWGAQGGSRYEDGTGGGKGGYSKGIINIEEETEIRIYVGGKGNAVSTNSTYAGAGINAQNPATDATTTDKKMATAAKYGGGGGGSTTIYLGNLYMRIIVAGGGGGRCGTENDDPTYCAGGAGGGEYGSFGNYETSGNDTKYSGQGGTQEFGGAAGTYSSYKGSAGIFGYGGYGGSKGSGAGGGGWYGGGGGTYDKAGGGGGSGWVYTEETAKYTTQEYMNGYAWMLDTEYYLKYAKTIVGDQCFPSADGETRDDCPQGQERGHSGDGYARISEVTEIIDPNIE